MAFSFAVQDITGVKHTIKKNSRGLGRLKLSNLYKGTKYTFLRGKILELKIPADSEKVVHIIGRIKNVLDAADEGTTDKPTNNQRIFRNSSIQYDHFKIISFQFHYWIADLGTTDSDSYQKMEMFKAYDRDGVDINHRKETIQSYVNCKFRRLQPESIMCKQSDLNICRLNIPDR